MIKNQDAFKRKVLLQCLAALDNCEIEPSISLQSTLQRLRQVKRDLELKTVAQLSGGLLQKLRSNEFSAPSQNYLAGMLLKSKSSKARSIASQETDDGSSLGESQGSRNRGGDNDYTSIRVVSY